MPASSVRRRSRHSVAAPQGPVPATGAWGLSGKASIQPRSATGSVTSNRGSSTAGDEDLLAASPASAAAPAAPSAAAAAARHSRARCRSSSSVFWSSISSKAARHGPAAASRGGVQVDGCRGRTRAGSRPGRTDGWRSSGACRRRTTWRQSCRVSGRRPAGPIPPSGGRARGSAPAGAAPVGDQVPGRELRRFSTSRSKSRRSPGAAPVAARGARPLRAGPGHRARAATGRPVTCIADRLREHRSPRRAR